MSVVMWHMHIHCIIACTTIKTDPWVHQVLQMLMWASLVWNIAIFGAGIIIYIYAIKASHVIIMWPGFVGGSPPPQEPPTEIINRLTLNGSVPLEYYYVDDSNKGLGMWFWILMNNYHHVFPNFISILGTHYKYSYDDITTLMEQAQRFAEQASSLPTPSAPGIISSSVTWLTQLSDLWLVKALQNYPINGLHVVGSKFSK